MNISQTYLWNSNQQPFNFPKIMFEQIRAREERRVRSEEEYRRSRSHTIIDSAKYIIFTEKKLLFFIFLLVFFFWEQPQRSFWIYVHVLAKLGRNCWERIRRNRGLKIKFLTS